MEDKKILNDEELEKATGGCDVCQIALKVINGDFGTGEVQKRRLREAGYDFYEVRNAVNRILAWQKRHPDSSPDCYLNIVL